MPIEGRAGLIGAEVDTKIAAHAALLTGIHGEVRKRKETTETVNNTTTLQNDDELFFPVAANEICEVSFFLRVNSSAVADLKVAITVPTGGSALYSKQGDVVTLEKTEGQGSSLSTGGADEHYVVRGIVVNGATAGNVQLQWAQNTAEVSNSSVLLNSFLIARRLA